MPQKIGILSSERGFHVLALEAAIREKGREAVYFPIKQLAGWVGQGAALHARGACLEECHAIIVRTIPAGSLEQIIFRMDALHRLENIGVRVINPASAIERTVDKYYTSFLMADAGIPTPRTLVTEDFETALDACRDMKDVVLKPLFGSEGKGMVRAADFETAYRVLRSWELNRYIYYIQEYIPHHERDVRAFIAGGRVIAAMLRSGAGWKTNYSKGAEVAAVKLSAEMESLALKCTELLHLDYAGVDLMTSEDGRTYVIEINSIPGWRGLQKTTEADIAGSVVECALS
jgi:RimK family alpha-L-glutamate ligase